MVAEVLPVFDPTPSSVAEIASRLPARERARIEWFPQALRRSFIEPLARASQEDFHVRLEELTLDAVRTVLQLVANLSTLTAILAPDAIAQAIKQDVRNEVWDELIRQRLEPVDAGAADDLREAQGWLRAILATTSIILAPALRGLDVTAQVGSLAQDVDAISDADLRRELIGCTRSFFRGLLLTIGALDVLERSKPPVTFVEWCALALIELSATANVFRAAGIPVPAEVVIPGYSASAWRERRQTRGTRRAPARLDFLARGDACPPGVLGRIVDVMRPEEIWLFGSRARGAAGPESDWDLLVVVPDSTSTPIDNATWAALRDVRRQHVDLVPIRRSEFEADRHEFGTLAQIATASGRRVYGG